MKIYTLNKATVENAKHIDTLLHMLDAGAPSVCVSRLSELISDENFKLFIAEAGTGEMAGMLTLTYCQTLSRRKYWIEDVIVDGRFRGQGIGRALIRAALEHVGKKEESPAVYLTSNPSRTAARALYLSEGFEEYETGVFRIITEHQDGQ